MEKRSPRECAETCRKIAESFGTNPIARANWENLARQCEAATGDIREQVEGGSPRSREARQRCPREL